VAEVPKKVSSGIPELDLILGGGFPHNRVCLVEGIPGTGKTTLAFQFLLEGTRTGEKVLYVTFSESKGELQQVAESHGWSFEGVNLLELENGGEKLLTEEQYTVFHPAEVELSATTQRIIDEVNRAKPLRVVIDSLSEIRLIAREPLRYRRQILALKEILSKCGCTVLFLEDEEDRSNGRDMLLESVAHSVVLLEREQAAYGGIRRKLQVTKMRGVDFLNGYHDFAIRRGGIQVFPRLVASRTRRTGMVPSKGTLSTGIPELDQLMGSGLPWGTGVLIVGPAGTGKSTLGSQFAWAAASKGHRVSAYLFEELSTTLLERAQKLGMGLEPYIQDGRVAINQVDPAELTPGEFAYKVCQQVEKEKTRVVLIDSLNGYMNAMANERFLVVQMHELLSYLNERGVITILIATQHGIIGNTENTPFELTYLADLVILLRYFEAAGTVCQAISVLKNRRAANERTIREFEIAKDGIRIGQPLSDFRGILSGVPVFEGKSSDLLAK
jgi:circadian clock protein KaiC